MATAGEDWNSSIRWARATLSAKNSFMATKAPAWTFATSLAGIAGNEGDIVNAGVKAGVVLGTRVGSVTSGNRFVTTGMWGIGTVVGEAMMGIVWAIDASGGISPKCAGPEVGGPMGVRSPWGGYRIPSSLYNYYEMGNV